MNKKQKLYNRIDKKELRKSLANETFSRFTVTFYRYICIKSPLEMRDILYREWNDLRIFGRVYIAAEGINAQICVPEHKWSDFNDQLNSMHELKGMQVKRALDEGPSFYKLTIKV